MEKWEGNQKLISPFLTHLEGWYFYQQMRKFREGKRGYHPRDEGGRVIAATSKELSDYDIKNASSLLCRSFGLHSRIDQTRSISQAFLTTLHIDF